MTKKTLKLKSEFRRLKGTDDYVLPITLDPAQSLSAEELFKTAGKEKFTIDELMYQLPANPKGKLKDILLAALMLRAIKASIKRSKKTQNEGEILLKKENEAIVYDKGKKNKVTRKSK